MDIRKILVFNEDAMRILVVSIRNTMLLLFIFSGCFEAKASNMDKMILGNVEKAFIEKDRLVTGKHFSVYDIDSDSKGNLFIAKFRQNEILVMDQNLNKLELIKDIETPHGIAIDKSGAIYVATFMKGRVLKFTKEWKKVNNWDQEIKNSSLLKKPVSIDDDELGNIYIADYDGNILKADSNGKFILKFETKEFLKESRFLPHSITVHDNKVYITDRVVPGKGVIRVFNVDGKYLKTFDAPEEGMDPLAFEAINNDLFLVPNYWKEKLFYLYSQKGKIVGFFGATGNKDRQFMAPTNLTFNANGLAYIVEEKSNRIHKVELKHLRTHLN